MKVKLTKEEIASRLEVKLIKECQRYTRVEKFIVFYAVDTDEFIVVDPDDARECALCVTADVNIAAGYIYYNSLPKDDKIEIRFHSYSVGCINVALFTAAEIAKLFDIYASSEKMQKLFPDFMNFVEVSQLYNKSKIVL